MSKKEQIFDEPIVKYGVRDFITIKSVWLRVADIEQHIESIGHRTSACEERMQVVSNAFENPNCHIGIDSKASLMKMFANMQNPRMVFYTDEHGHYDYEDWKNDEVEFECESDKIRKLNEELTYLKGFAEGFNGPHKTKE